jgi:calcium-dependent protein kinase
MGGISVYKVLIKGQFIINTFHENINTRKMESKPEEGKGDQFLIRKQTMIRKNEQDIGDVYKISKKPLGSGAYGVVSLCKHKMTGQERAVKCVAKKKIKNMDRFKQEIIILQTLDHPNVLKLYEYFEDKKNVYLITEICRGGELFDRIIENEFFSEKVAAKIFK